MNIIDKVLNEWLAKYGFSARIREMEADFGWYASNDTICYSLLVNPEEEERWEELMVECGLRYEVPTFVSAFLHELGHSMTYFDIDDETLDMDEETKNLIAEEPSSFADIYDVYYHLPSEIIATMWMVGFINNNVEKVIELTQMVHPAIMKFYEECGYAS